MAKTLTLSAAKEQIKVLEAQLAEVRANRDMLYSHIQKQAEVIRGMSEDRKHLEERVIGATHDMQTAATLNVQTLNDLATFKDRVNRLERIANSALEKCAALDIAPLLERLDSLETRSGNVAVRIEHVEDCMEEANIPLWKPASSAKKRPRKAKSKR